jgi:hypothetical protein
LLFAVNYPCFGQAFARPRSIIGRCRRAIWKSRRSPKLPWRASRRRRADQYAYAVGRAYFVAEIVFDVEALVSRGGRRRIELKRELLQGHEFCRAIAPVREDRMEVVLDIRERGRRTSMVLRNPDAKLSIPSLGLRCFLANI